MALWRGEKSSQFVRRARDKSPCVLRDFVRKMWLARTVLSAVACCRFCVSNLLEVPA